MSEDFGRMSTVLIDMEKRVLALEEWKKVLDAQVAQAQALFKGKAKLDLFSK